METIFNLSGMLTMPFWFLMLALPHWRWTRRIVGSVWIVAPAAMLYAGLVLPEVATIFPAVASPTLDAIAALLGTPAGATVAWAHFLAFDLFVGRWVYLDSREREISAWPMAPLLFLTLMLGPVGFLLYVGLRPALTRRAAAQQPAII